MCPKCACGERDGWYKVDGDQIVCKWCDRFYRKLFHDVNGIPFKQGETNEYEKSI